MITAVLIFVLGATVPLLVYHSSGNSVFAGVAVLAVAVLGATFRGRLTGDNKAELLTSLTGITKDNLVYASLSTHDNLSREFDRIIDDLRRMVLELQLSSEQTTSSAESLVDSTQQVEAGTQAMAASLEVIFSSLTEQTTSILDSVSEARNRVLESEAVLTKRIAGTQALAAFSEGIGQLFVHLESQTKRVDRITKTIDEIAEQINILSINASIEAALAGDKGKGFAVLAGEVRELAASASEATADTRKVLNGIKQEIANVGLQIEESKLLAATELAGIEEARTGLRAMSESIGAISGVVEQFADQAGSQLKNAGELVQGQNEAVATISSAAADLAKLSDELYSGMSNFGGMQSGADTAKELMQAAQQELQTIAQNQAFISMETEAMKIGLQPLAEKYELAFVADKHGDLKAFTKDAAFTNIAFRGYFRQARAGKSVVSSVYISPASNLPCVTIVVPVKRGEEVVGVLGADLRLVITFDELKAKAKAKEDLGVAMDIGVETF